MKPDHFSTPQEEFWAGDFGNEYITRNDGDSLLASNINFFTRALKQAGKLRTSLELGANIGMNLKALKLLYPGMKQKGIEINEEAGRRLSELIGRENVFNGSIFDYSSDETFDLTFTKGVMIHINPERLNEVYEKLFIHSGKYILVCEYYNPVPVMISYRGHSDRLFKRDFAGEMMKRYPSLKLVDYGFVYHNDNTFPLDDINWFLMEK